MQNIAKYFYIVDKCTHNRLHMSLQLIPSVYAREMCQTTEERLSNTYEMHPPRILELLDMSETTHHKVKYQHFTMLSTRA